MIAGDGDLSGGIVTLDGVGFWRTCCLLFGVVDRAKPALLLGCFWGHSKRDGQRGLLRLWICGVLMDKVGVGDLVESRCEWRVVGQLDVLLNITHKG